VIPSADNQDVPNVHDNPIPEPAEIDEGQEYPPKPELEPNREPDMFDNEEEYVGVNDELMYMPVPQTQTANHAQVAKNHAHSSNNHVDENGVGAAEGGDPLEAEIDDADPQEVHVIHDPENPKIVVGGQFPGIISFRKAIRHYAVKTGFEYAGLVTNTMLTVYFGTPSMFITLWFGFDYGTNSPLGTLII
jgi:hypothetical protein